MNIIKYFKHQYLADFEGVFHNQISISNEQITISITLAQFLEFVPDYVLPSGYQQRDYVQDQYNKLYTPDESVVEDIVPWPEGDVYIANAQNYIPVPPVD
ncbi:hypothetical protein UFOVP459_4 [uncultured Caudovirales phage]|uniref:Uncharacterized protein n=1 Tax=uncultured Caudovirales phage TaxID=2100421 RepID=A0A6J5MFS1_9CAUD|nr:hypothetical protein UFOVP459_4 [uncultured Caudovirales phage]CAB4182487.1 hypothetical protein UFOVP1089_5 [uncultured Caudovirales phage]CAB4212562.1 hypothetical protein UFOVP1443_24 [uncultured Caudovirales phage]